MLVLLVILGQQEILTNITSNTEIHQTNRKIPVSLSHTHTQSSEFWPSQDVLSDIFICYQLSSCLLIYNKATSSQQGAGGLVINTKLTL